MKRLNRKKILEVLETARQGFSSTIIKAISGWNTNLDELVWEKSSEAHHHHLNKILILLNSH